MLSSNKREVYFEAVNRDSYVETRAAKRRSGEKFVRSYSVANPVRRNLRARRSRNTRKTLCAQSREEKLHRRCVPRGFHLGYTNELASCNIPVRGEDLFRFDPTEKYKLICIKRTSCSPSTFPWDININIHFCLQRKNEFLLSDVINFQVLFVKREYNWKSESSRMR